MVNTFGALVVASTLILEPGRCYSINYDVNTDWMAVEQGCACLIYGDACWLGDELLISDSLKTAIKKRFEFAPEVEFQQQLDTQLHQTVSFGSSSRSGIHYPSRITVF